MNPFEFYGLTPHLLIDEAELRHVYLNIQRSWHPDFFASMPEKEAEAAEKTSLNNTFYQKLNTLPGRMQTLLEMHGMTGETGNILPQDFLMEMMELNEETEAAMNDAGHSQAMVKQLQEKQRQVLNEATQLGEWLGAKIVEPEGLKKLQVLYQKLRYLTKLNERLNQIKRG